MRKLVVLLLLTFLLITGCNSVEVTRIDDDNETDSLKFNKEYPIVSRDNVFEYYTYDNIIDKIENGTGIIYLGYPSCKNCDITVSLLDTISKDKKIEEISYYNIEDMMKNNTSEYQKLIKIIGLDEKEETTSNLNDDNKNDITAPIVVFVKNGIIKKAYIINDYESDTLNIKNELITDFNLIYENDSE